MAEAFTVGVDVGGTFTDIVAVSTLGRVVTAKAPTTPANQADGVLDGIAIVAADLGLAPDALLGATTSVVHGTTTATNTMLEFDGARTYMLTTRGFRDVLDFRLNIKEGAFDLRVPPPHALVPRRRRLPITERIDHAGRVLRPLADDDVVRAAQTLAGDAAEAVAICFLFSFVDPRHELRARDILREALPDLHISLSHEVLPKIREFERFSTTVVDAYVARRLDRYLARLEQRLTDAGFGGDLLIMKSNGGATAINRARKRLGAELVMSGPAGGAIAAGRLAERVDTPDVITMDMGGTSLDVSVLRAFTPRIGASAWINRHHVGIAVIEVTSVGAGGGSVAWVDDGGALRIGPQSAGATPGPAAYGRGGTLPTVTDADLVLGLLSSELPFAAGAPLDVAAARAAIKRHVADPLGMSVSDAALAIARVVNASMVNALSLVSIQKGYDPREFALMAFGGAGPIHAAALIEDLGIGKVLVPRTFAPVLCALGDTLADVRESNAQAFLARGPQLDPARLEALFAELVERSEADIGEKALRLPGRVDRGVSMRYVGQTHELVAPVEGDLLSDPEAAWNDVVSAFHDLHQEQFSFSQPQAETEVIGAQIDRWAFRASSWPSPVPPRTSAAASAPRSRQALFAATRAYEPVDVYDGPSLEPGFRADGPVIVQEPYSAIVAYPGQTLRLDAAGMFVIEAGDGG